FQEFDDPEVWFDPGHSVIDSTVVRHDGHYYRFTKDERGDGECGKVIVAERSDDLLDPMWDLVAERIGHGHGGEPGSEMGEGSSIFESNSEVKWYRFVDEWSERGYVPFETTNLDSGEASVSSDCYLPESHRLGTVMTITQQEHERLAGE